MLLPIHPQPKSDELLSSWVTRLVIENGLFSFVFFNQLLDFHEPLLTRDLDRLHAPQLTKLLASATGVSLNTIRQLTLTSYQGEVFESHNPNGNTRWILPLSIYHRRRRGTGITYCPLCLKHDKTRYFRKCWRLAFVTLCHEHGCMLLDKCFCCGANVEYQRLGVGSREYELPATDLSLCQTCGHFLWEGPINKLSAELQLLSGPYCSLLKAFHQGAPLIEELEVASNLQILLGIWFICSGLMGRRAGAVRDAIYRETGVRLNKKNSNEPIEYYSIEERTKLLIVTLHYLQDWPDKFCRLVDKTTFTSSAYSDVLPRLPYWLAKIVLSDMNMKQYHVTDDEIGRAKDYLNQIQSPCTLVHLSQLLGMHVSSLSKRINVQLQNKS